MDNGTLTPPPPPSVNRTSIDKDNGLSPIRRHAIIQTNARLMSIGPLRNKFSDILIQMHFFIDEIASENIVLGMAAIYSRER